VIFNPVSNLPNTVDFQTERSVWLQNLTIGLCPKTLMTIKLKYFTKHGMANFYNILTIILKISSHHTLRCLYLISLLEQIIQLTKLYSFDKI
jgi:hypothetical protein